MLEIKEAMFKGKPASVFVLDRCEAAPARDLSEIAARLRERFRCGDSPRPGHTPLIGQIAFIRASAQAQPMLAALTHELGSLFDAICVQADAQRYIVSVARPGLSTCALGEAIAVSEVKEHADPWSR